MTFQANSVIAWSSSFVACLEPFGVASIIGLACVVVYFDQSDCHRHVCRAWDAAPETIAIGPKIQLNGAWQVRDVVVVFMHVFAVKVICCSLGRAVESVCMKVFVAGEGYGKRGIGDWSPLGIE